MHIAFFVCVCIPWTKSLHAKYEWMRIKIKHNIFTILQYKWNRNLSFIAYMMSFQWVFQGNNSLIQVKKNHWRNLFHFYSQPFKNTIYMYILHIDIGIKTATNVSLVHKRLISYHSELLHCIAMNAQHGYRCRKHLKRVNCAIPSIWRVLNFSFADLNL